MKIEVEVDDADIASIAKKQVLKEIEIATYSWKVNELVKTEVAKRLPLVIHDMVQENMQNLESIRESVADEIQRKLKAQITAAMKKAGQ